MALKVKKFAKQLQMEGKEYDGIKHWDGTNIITAKKMDDICKEHFGRDYILLTDNEQKKIVDKLFKHLRDYYHG